MAEFLGDLTVFAGIALAVQGLMLLHRARGPDSSLWLRTAGFLALAIGLGGALSASTSLFTYRTHGDFDRAYPAMMMKSMEGKEMMMDGHGGMGMMMGGQSGMGMMGGPMAAPSEPARPSAPPAGGKDKGHESHHP